MNIHVIDNYCYLLELYAVLLTWPRLVGRGCVQPQIMDFVLKHYKIFMQEYYFLEKYLVIFHLCDIVGQIHDYHCFSLTRCDMCQISA